MASADHPAGGTAVTPPSLDSASAEWVRTLTGLGAERDAALARLHELLHVYVELIAEDAATARRYPGVRVAPAGLRAVHGGLRRAAGGGTRPGWLTTWPATTRAANRE